LETPLNGTAAAGIGAGEGVFRPSESVFFAATSGNGDDDDAGVNTLDIVEPDRVL
jgi:hypothetical protein